MDIIGGRALIGDDLVPADVGFDGPLIAPSRPGAAHGPWLDAAGLLVLPGLVDIHGDAFERQVMPRPGVGFDLTLALKETDRQLVANGITTAFHGVTWSWEPGLRGRETTLALVDAIERLRPALAADTLIHLRHEIFNLDAEAEILAWIRAGRLGCIAFNDHMEGTVKARHRPDKLFKMRERTGLSEADFQDLIDRIYARREEVPGSIERIAAAAVATRLPALSHDDMTPDMRRWFHGLGVRIAEFPVTEETAEASAALGDAIVFGAPNVVRGGSHTGCPAAEEMVRAGLCDILASDYYYPAMLQAAFRLVAPDLSDLGRIWSLVSAAPAKASGLTDRGRIAPGARGDVVLVDPDHEGHGPAVIATLVAGRLVHLADGRRLRSR